MAERDRIRRIYADHGYSHTLRGGRYMGDVYSFEDTTVEPGKTYYYKLEDIDYNGKSTFHDPVSVSRGLLDDAGGSESGAAVNVPGLNRF